MHPPAPEGPQDEASAVFCEYDTAAAGRLISEAIDRYAEELANVYERTATAHEMKAAALASALRASTAKVRDSAHNMASANLEHSGVTVLESRPRSGNGSA
jgi:hypothetical protein